MKQVCSFWDRFQSFFKQSFQLCNFTFFWKHGQFYHVCVFARFNLDFTIFIQRNFCPVPFLVHQVVSQFGVKLFENVCFCEIQCGFYYLYSEKLLHCSLPQHLNQETSKFFISLQVFRSFELISPKSKSFSFCVASFEEIFLRF